MTYNEMYPESDKPLMRFFGIVDGTPGYEIIPWYVGICGKCCTKNESFIRYRQLINCGRCGRQIYLFRGKKS